MTNPTSNHCLHTWESFDDGQPVQCQRPTGHVGPHASSPDRPAHETQPTASNLVAYTWTGEGMIPAIEGDRKRYYLASDIEELLARRVDTAGWLDSHKRQMPASVVDVSPPDETAGDDAADAAKWRALRNCARMTAMGSAGLTPGTATYDTDYAHVTLNFWTGGKYDSPGDPYAREWLDGFVAKALGANTSPLEPWPRHLTEPEREAMGRALERSQTVIDDGSEPTEPQMWYCQNCKSGNRVDFHHTSCPACGKLRPAEKASESPCGCSTMTDEYDRVTKRWCGKHWSERVTVNGKGDV